MRQSLQVFPHLVLWTLLLSARGSEFLYPPVPQDGKSRHRCLLSIYGSILLPTARQKFLKS